MNEKTLAREELIGLHVTIKECKDSKWTGKSGVIIDETKNTFLIRIDNENKRIAKKIAKFEFEHDEKKAILNGSKIAYRSEDRIKKAR
ncbi:MAG: ribonuclease P protein subunit [Thermoplasmatales archaeon]|nr:ribonuclease P protein subunit [Thermoplasmatales archaeon]